MSVAVTAETDNGAYTFLGLRVPKWVFFTVLAVVILIVLSCLYSALTGGSRGMRGGAPAGLAAFGGLADTLRKNVRDRVVDAPILRPSLSEYLSL